MTRRVRRRVEGAAVLLAFPLAVAITVVAIAPSPSGPLASPSGRPDVAAGAGLAVSLAGPDPVVAYATADRLAAEGYDLTGVSPSLDDANSLSGATVVVYYERERRAAAVRLRDLLGGGTIRLDHVLEPSSDLTVLLGKDPQRT